MADVASQEAATASLSTPAKRKPGQHFEVRRQLGFTTMAIVCFFLLYAPITALVIYSFNAGSSLALWEGFSFRWYVSAWHNEAVQEAALRSLVLATQASLFATTLATMAALGTTRTKPFRGQTTVFALINQPLMVPEIVTAVALLVVFAMVKTATGYTGLGYLVLAHTAFCIPFAYLPIRARLEGMDSALETAAADLYATRWQTFRHVISLDDVVITEFVKSAGQETLPTYMLGQFRRVITPEINAISTALLAISVLLVALFFVLSRRDTGRA